MATGIMLADTFQTRLGIGVVLSLTTYGAPVRVDIVYGDEEVDYCFLRDSKRPVWAAVWLRNAC